MATEKGFFRQFRDPALVEVFARGKRMMADGRLLVRGTFSE